MDGLDAELTASTDPDSAGIESLIERSRQLADRVRAEVESGAGCGEDELGQTFAAVHQPALDRLLAELAEVPEQLRELDRRIARADADEFPSTSAEQE